MVWLDVSSISWRNSHTFGAEDHQEWGLIIAHRSCITIPNIIHQYKSSILTRLGITVSNGVLLEPQCPRAHCTLSLG
jgi:hypothetical protein